MRPKEMKKCPAKAIMIVGTTSNAGKSLVAAALCRYFKRKGKNVAPYKAQNMALNSYVTEEGGEMGRAQVMQCEAAKIKPHTDMNPVLLKPQGNSISQLIVNGKAIDNVTAQKYYEGKTGIRDIAWTAYDRLNEKYDLIIMEGAGSPTEINILKYDFVNMAAAEYANAKTILVADIDRGGVFASIFGTIKLLPEKFQKLFSGIIINKFRGDVRLLDSGIQQIEKLTGIPVLGILPFVPNLQIEEEDSLGLETKNSPISKNLSRNLSKPAHSSELDIKVQSQFKPIASSNKNRPAYIDIAIIKLPCISNYTDFLPFENQQQISLRYISTIRQLDNPDLIIIPGTKTTCTDMQYLSSSGLAEAIKKLNKKGTPIIGICGGYQMLGKTVSDPDGIEGNIKEISGLSLLDIKTTLKSKKELAQVSGYTTDAYPFTEKSENICFYGYEIHSGNTIETDFSSEKPIIITKRRNENCIESVGSISKDKNVFGCYIHGFFDTPSICNGLIKFLADKKGIKVSDIHFQDKDIIYEHLADLIEGYIDFSKML
jgi:adenosylcobyric acid synthase